MFSTMASCSLKVFALQREKPKIVYNAHKIVKRVAIDGKFLRAVVTNSQKENFHIQIVYRTAIKLIY